MIRDLLREYCKARSCHHHGPEAEDAARRLVVLYRDGSDGDELRGLLLHPMRGGRLSRQTATASLVAIEALPATGPS